MTHSAVPGPAEATSIDGRRPLENAVALVTGAGRGIGRAIAERLAADGAAVCLVARSVDELDATRESIVDAGGYLLWDVETAIRELSDLLLAQPLIRDVHFWAQLPGESVESGSARIETLTSKVLPAVRERLAAAEVPAT